MEKLRILVLDGGHRNALAIIRHLGKTKNYIIDTVSYSKNSLCFFSKYVRRSVIVRDPKQDPEGYLDDLISLLRSKEYLVVIPVSYISYQICSAHKEQIRQYTKLTIADSRQIAVASSKVETYKLAEDLGIPYPKLIPIGSLDEIESVETSYPCVIKAPFEAGVNIVEYAKNKNDLVQKYRKIVSEHDFDGHLPLLQKFIVGEGAGFFALYKNGVCKNYFVHRRIREYPVTGGASSCAESFYDDDIIKYGKLILDTLKWEGVAMVEFKRDNSTGIFNLMEINAKFWGSLDLSLVAGVNFPQMLVDDACGVEIAPLEKFENRRFQWILNGDLFHVIERPWHVFAFVRDLFVAKNDLYVTDIKPNLFQMAYVLVYYYRKWRQ